MLAPRKSASAAGSPWRCPISGSVRLPILLSDMRTRVRCRFRSNPLSLPGETQRDNSESADERASPVVELNKAAMSSVSEWMSGLSAAGSRLAAADGWTPGQAFPIAALRTTCLGELSGRCSRGRAVNTIKIRIRNSALIHTAYYYRGCATQQDQALRQDCLRSLPCHRAIVQHQHGRQLQRLGTSIVRTCPRRNPSRVKVPGTFALEPVSSAFPRSQAHACRLPLQRDHSQEG